MKISNLKEFKFGWRVVLAAAIGIGLGMSPLPFYTIGVFAAPLSKQFSWGMDTIMMALPIFTFGALFASPLVGYLADKYGVRKITLISVLIFGLTFIAFSFNTGSKPLYYALWAMLAITGAGTLPITWTRAVNNWFNENRGLALGLSLLGTGLFGALAKLYASYFIENYSWQAAYIAVGLLPILIAFPIAFVFFRDIDDPKVADRAKKLREEIPIHAKSGALAGLTVKEAVMDWRFWILAFAFVPISFAIGGPIPNLERMLTSKGFTGTDVVILASFIGYAVIIGRLVGGFLIDRFWAPGVAFILLSIPAVSCYLFQVPDLDYQTAALAVVILGFAAGVEFDLIAFLVSRYFGMKNYAAIYGFIYGFFALGAGFGPYFYGKSFAESGSYDQMLTYSIYGFLIGAVLLLFLGKYPNFDKSEQTPV